MSDTTWYGGYDPRGRWPTGGGPGVAEPPPGAGRPPHQTPPAPRRTLATTVSALRPDRRAGVLVVIMAIAFDAAAHARVDAVATTGLLCILAGALLASGRMRSTSAAVVALMVVPFAFFLSWRESVWLVPVDAVLAAVLLLVAASYAAGGRLVRISVSAVVIRAARWVLSAALGPAFLFGAVAALLPIGGEARKRHIVALARGVGMAVPVVVVLGLLLASADPVFASVFRIPLDAAGVVTHSLFLVVGLLLASALFVEASSEPLDDLAVDAQPLGATEAGVVLAGLVLLYGVFTGSQVVAARGGAEKVLSTAGLTYAAYAREGFFQLLAVAGITLVILLGVRALTAVPTRSSRLTLTLLGEAAIVLTLGIVGVAINRLGLYEQAYGLTMLRLTCTVVAWWLGAVFVLVGLAYAGVGRTQRWLAGAIALSFVVALAGFDVVDPEAVVVRRNVDHALTTGMFDDAYLGELSDDAVPALAASLPRLDPEDRAAALARICRRPSRRPVAPDDRSGLTQNRSAADAAETRAAVCQP